MLIINPSVELIKQGDNIISHVARCARVCYDKETGNDDEKLHKDLIRNRHLSVFRHVTYYAIAPSRFLPVTYSFIYDGSLLMFNTVGITADCYDDYDYIVYNGNFAIEHPILHNKIKEYHVSPEEFANTEIGFRMMRYTFKITTQNSTAKELNRVSPNNITEMSTRYVDLKNGAICRPHWMSDLDVYNLNNYYFDDVSKKVYDYMNQCESSFKCYERLKHYYGLKGEDARGVLPLDTATKVIYTYSVNEWKHIIELRTNKRAHPNAQIIANMVKNELEELGYDF